MPNGTLAPPDTFATITRKGLLERDVWDMKYETQCRYTVTDQKTEC